MVAPRKGALLASQNRGIDGVKPSSLRPSAYNKNQPRRTAISDYRVQSLNALRVALCNCLQPTRSRADGISLNHKTATLFDGAVEAVWKEGLRDSEDLFGRAHDRKRVFVYREDVRSVCAGNDV